MSITNYKNLTVWQKSMDLVTEIYIITRELPKDEQYGLVSQMRRAAVSIPSNISEGHGRSYTKEYVHFLAIAQGSKAELETQLMIANRLGFLSQEQIESSLNLCDEIGKMLTTIIRKLQNRD